MYAETGIFKHLWYKVTGEVEKEHFQCLPNDVGFNNSHGYSYRGEWGFESVCVWEEGAQTKP